MIYDLVNNRQPLLAAVKGYEDEISRCMAASTLSSGIEICFVGPRRDFGVACINGLPIPIGNFLILLIAFMHDQLTVDQLKYHETMVEQMFMAVDGSMPYDSRVLQDKILHSFPSAICRETIMQMPPGTAFPATEEEHTAELLRQAIVRMLDAIDEKFIDRQSAVV